MPVTWETYLSPNNAAALYRTCSQRYGPAFAPLRDLVERLVEHTKPTSVACLGAGVLNDLPLKALVRSGAELHLVDWLPGIIDSGLSASIIESPDDAKPSCVFCALDKSVAEDYCRNYCGPKPVKTQVCAGYLCEPPDLNACAAYQRGTRPHVHRADVTGGYASEFANRCERALRNTTTWRQALRQAIALARRVPARPRPLDIPDGSIDLAISSMVVSQFLHEPYDYFTRQAEEALGTPTARENKRLLRQADDLKATLFKHSLEGHFAEIERVLAPEGQCFMAFELFHYDAEIAEWMLVEPMHETLKRIADRFRLDFDTTHDHDLYVRYSLPGTDSLLSCLTFTRR